MKPIIALAPLAGYTSMAYRRFMKPFGCDLVVSEMISDFALFYHNEETFKMIATSKDEQPVGIQLFGGSQDSLIKGLTVLQEKAEYDFLDINLGCPVNKVVKNNAGSAWLKKERQEELFLAINSLVKLSKVPVTCKIRLGWNDDEINVIETCKLLEKAGVKLITIHGRTRAQMYAGEPNYELIKKAKENVNIPILANGNIDSLEKAIKVLDYTKCDGISLGRGVLGNPYLITQIKRYFEDGTILPPSTIEMQLKYLEEHFQKLKEEKGEYVAISQMRGIASWYLKGFKNVREYKIRFSSIKSEKDLMEIIHEIEQNKLIER